jgi:hypothetical protein
MDASAIQQLREQLKGIEQGAFERAQRTVSSSFSEIDSWLPQGGWVLGSFVELLQEQSGCGSYSLALKCARQAAENKPAWAVLDNDASFYVPAAQALGWDLQKLVLVRAAPNDSGWAFAQLLRSRDLGACFWASSSMDNMVFRRLQLAAERGGGLGFVMRPMSALRKPCWGSCRIQVAPSGSGKVRLKLLHARGQPHLSRDDIEVVL